jgi:hypothetical protein
VDFQHPAHEDTPKAKAILFEADQVADALGLDHELVDGVVVGLGPLSLLAAALPSLPEPIGRTTLALKS